MKIALTGVSGYLGRNLLERLGREGLGGAELLGLDLAGVDVPASRLRYVRRDVRDPALAGDLEGYDTVVHMAFVVEAMRDRALMYDVNLGGSRNLLRACERAGVRNLIVTSSVAAYGIQGDRVITEDTPLLGAARSCYAHTKRLVEEELDVFEARNPATRVVRVRPSIVLGPRCNTWALDALGGAQRLDTRRGIRIPVVHEDDVTEVLWRAITTAVRGPLLVAHPEPLSPETRARLADGRRIVVPEWLMLRLADAGFALGLSRINSDWLLLAAKNSYRFDASKTWEKLGWRPQHEPESALSAALASYRGLAHAGARRASADRLEGTRHLLVSEDGAANHGHGREAAK